MDYVCDVILDFYRGVGWRVFHERVWKQTLKGNRGGDVSDPERTATSTSARTRGGKPPPPNDLCPPFQETSSLKSKEEAGRRATTLPIFKSSSQKGKEEIKARRGENNSNLYILIFRCDACVRRQEGKHLTPSIGGEGGKGAEARLFKNKKLGGQTPGSEEGIGENDIDSSTKATNDVGSVMSAVERDGRPTFESLGEVGVANGSMPYFVSCNFWGG